MLDQSLCTTCDYPLDENDACPRRCAILPHGATRAFHPGTIGLVAAFGVALTFLGMCS
jgi:hypothetical protein